MSIVAPHVGIDVAKLAAMVSIDGGKPFQVDNKESALLDLANLLPKGAVVHIESSGGYERVVRRVLEAQGFKVRVLNPLNCRRIAQAMGVRAKTDPIDARSLATMGRLLPSGDSKSLERQRLCDISRSIEELKRMIGGLRVRQKLPDLHEGVVNSYKRLVKVLCKEVRDLERLFKQEVHCTQYGPDFDLAQTVPGIGPVTARILVCELPENYKSRRLSELASYAGLAPLNDESGARQGMARIGRGNNRLKAAQYLPALTAVRRQEWAKSLYARLRSKGRTHRTAMIAVMRRMLTRAVEVMQRGTAWEAVRKSP